MQAILALVHCVLVLSLPIVLVGIVNRTKSWWAGRKGPRLLQSAYDLRKLVGKRPIYSSTAGPLFRSGAYIALLAGLLAASMAPILGGFAPLQFEHDFIVVAYTLGLGRIVLMLSAMDVGSAFEGMGAAREASFSAFVEPALFLLLGAATVATGHTSFASLLAGLHALPGFGWLVVPAVAALFILLQAEAARVPVDDPLTHLELTMVHEVMILDHSGPELAAMQYVGALKMSLYAGLIATLLNPLDPFTNPVGSIAVTLLLLAGVALAVGCVESLTARLPMRWVPSYLMAASAAALVCLVVVGVVAA